MTTRQTFFSRRSFLGASAAASAAFAIGAAAEPMLAWATTREFALLGATNAVFINANENPLGPCASARTAIAAVTPNGGRYRFEEMEEFVKSYAAQESVKTDYVKVYPG